MPRLDNTPFLMQSLDRHEKKIAELLKRVKELEAIIGQPEPKRGPGRPKKEENV